MFDEFQDTDPLQWSIFQKLFVENLSLEAFYLVGDPKQSIYSFRSADLYTYLNAAERMEKNSFLDTNYRSTPPLIRALNAFFSSIDTDLSSIS